MLSGGLVAFVVMSVDSGRAGLSLLKVPYVIV